MSQPAEFAFTPQDKAPDPDLGLERIPVDRYTDPAFLPLEDERIWSKTWLLAGAACDVAEPGDYFVFDNLRESILVTRGGGTVYELEVTVSISVSTSYLILPFKIK